MNREIKFRVYDKCRDRMFYTGNEIKKIEYNFETYMLCINGLENVLDCENEIEAVIMQYTGLKDKNGKEIYEGDIIKESKSIGTVIYNKGCFEIKWFENKDFYNNILEVHCHHCEVIGNIYENPELLKEV
ncbi:YopX family protein [Clostridium saccharoperbutylacetonicum]|uniref:YopX family protein n=1 Tax=Clostridium saccharoperbutylacetonicum TaxID=36745 RepID=UPI0039EB0210